MIKTIIKWVFRVICGIGYIFHLAIIPYMYLERNFELYEFESGYKFSTAGIALICLGAYCFYKGMNFLLTFIDSPTFTKLVKGLLIPIMPLLLAYFIADMCNDNIVLIKTIILGVLANMIIAIVINPFPKMMKEWKLYRLKRGMKL